MFDSVIIIDESQSTSETTILSSSRPTAFIPIFSDRGYGKDSDLKLFSGFSQSTLISRYGQPSLSTTLAPLFYAYEFLRGGGDVYIRRITSKTSTFAHAVLLAKGRVTSGIYEVKYVVQTINDSTDLDDLVVNAEALYSTTADVDGYQTYPIAVLGLNWSGTKGNNYTFRLLPDKSLEKSISQRGYQLEIRASATSSASTVSFSTSDDAMLDGVSVYANDYVEDQLPSVYFKMLDSFVAFQTAIADYLPDGETYPDIFFGAQKSTYVSYPKFTIVDSSVDFTAVGGIALAGGSDGDFAQSNASRVANMMTRLAESFSELPSLLLVNEYKYPVDFVFDFGAPQEVKDAIIGFVGRRQTTSAVIDTGSLSGYTSILNARKTGDLTYSDMNVIIDGGTAQVRDSFTNKKLTFPLTFFEAYALPNHIINVGSQYPTAGAKYSFDNMLEGSYQPQFYDENSDEVEAFVDNRINFVMEDDSQYSMFHQSTSLKTESALVERNNVFLLHQLIRIGLKTAKANRWNFAEDEDIERYQSMLIQNIGLQLDGKLGEFSLKAARESTIGAGRNRVLVTGTVRFKYLNKGTTFQFTVV